VAGFYTHVAPTKDCTRSFPFATDTDQRRRRGSRPVAGRGAGSLLSPSPVGPHRLAHEPFEGIERAFDRMRHQAGSLHDDLLWGAVPVDVAGAVDEFVVTADLPATSARPSTSNSPASPFPSRWTYG
jgi:hypothetical protein